MKQASNWSENEEKCSEKWRRWQRYGCKDHQLLKKETSTEIKTILRQAVKRNYRKTEDIKIHSDDRKKKMDKKNGIKTILN